MIVIFLILLVCNVISLILQFILVAYTIQNYEDNKIATDGNGGDATVIVNGYAVGGKGGATPGADGGSGRVSTHGGILNKSHSKAGDGGKGGGGFK